MFSSIWRSKDWTITLVQSALFFKGFIKSLLWLFYGVMICSMIECAWLQFYTRLFEETIKYKLFKIRIKTKSRPLPKAAF